MEKVAEGHVPTWTVLASGSGKKERRRKQFSSFYCFNGDGNSVRHDNLGWYIEGKVSNACLYIFLKKRLRIYPF